MPPMQNPSTATSRDVVVHDEVVGRGLEVAELQLVVELPSRTPCAPSGRRSARTSTGARANGSGAHTAKPCVASRRHRSSNSGRIPMMSGCSTSPRDGHAVGTGVDRVDRRAVDAA